MPSKVGFLAWQVPHLYFMIFWTSLKFTSSKEASLELVNFNEVQNIIKYRCGTCHAKNPTFDGIEVAPKGVVYDSPNDIIKNLKLIQAQAIDSEIMPPNNLTGITNQEREKLRIWIEQGANINN